MELVLKIDKGNLKTFTDLAESLNVKHYIISEELADEALQIAMEQGDDTLLGSDETIAFEAWLKK